MLHTLQNKFFLPASWNRVFLVTFVFITMAAGLFWLDFFRSYQAEVTILTISRPGVSQSGAVIAGNLLELTQTLSFYDRVLSDNDLINDESAGAGPDKRKEYWKSKVSVKNVSGGSVLTLRALSNTAEEAKLLAKQTTQTLFSVAGLYYNVKTDIDLRIIDGPLVSYVLVSPFLFGITSLASGFFVTVIFFLFLNMVPGFIEKRKETVSSDEAVVRQNTLPEKAYSEYTFSNESMPWIDPKKFVPMKPTTLSFETVAQETKKTFGSVVHAPAPANLPVATNEMNLPIADEATLPFEFEASPEELGVVFPSEHDALLETSSPNEPKELLETIKPTFQKGELATMIRQSEPTAEEYKRRLNKLLSGIN